MGVEVPVAAAVDELVVEVVVATERYGAMVAGSWTPSFSSQHVEFCNPQHHDPSGQVYMFLISVGSPPFFISLSLISHHLSYTLKTSRVK